MLAVYRQYWRINFLTMLEYRANFVMWFFFAIVYHGVALGALYVTMQHFPSMNGWSFREMFFLYALWMTGHELHNTLFFTIVSVPEYVREGRFDRFLVRPLDTLFSVLTVPQQIVPDSLLIAIATLVVSIHAAGVRLDWALIVFLPAIVAGGALIDLGISLALQRCRFGSFGLTRSAGSSCRWSKILRAIRLASTRVAYASCWRSFCPLPS